MKDVQLLSRDFRGVVEMEREAREVTNAISQVVIQIKPQRACLRESESPRVNDASNAMMT